MLQWSSIVLSSRQQPRKLEESEEERRKRKMEVHPISWEDKGPGDWPVTKGLLRRQLQELWGPESRKWLLEVGQDVRSVGWETLVRVLGNTQWQVCSVLSLDWYHQLLPVSNLDMHICSKSPTACPSFVALKVKLRRPHLGLLHPLSHGPACAVWPLVPCYLFAICLCW